MKSRRRKCHDLIVDGIAQRRIFTANATPGNWACDKFLQYCQVFHAGRDFDLCQGAIQIAAFQ